MDRKKGLRVFMSLNINAIAHMYKVLDKDSIMTEIVSYLWIPVHGPGLRAPIAEIVNAVLYKFKSGVQWHMLPVSELFTGEPLHYKTVFGHYHKWCKGGSWKDCWVQFLSRNRANIAFRAETLTVAIPRPSEGAKTWNARGGKSARPPMHQCV
ncbi:MAG: hypothetical protein QM485_03000 [Flavobacteriaceae bacterium]